MEYYKLEIFIPEAYFAVKDVHPYEEPVLLCQA